MEEDDEDFDEDEDDEDLEVPETELHGVELGYAS